MTKFTLSEITKTQVGRREEDTYLYTGEDGSTVKFHALSQPFTWEIKASDPFLGRKVVNAYISAGMRQHEYAGGFDEAIKVLEV